MGEEDAFVRAILQDPYDDTPRLVYADWLEERGDPRGGFVRIQCALARPVEGDPRAKPSYTMGELYRWEDSQPHRRQLVERERQLLTEHGATWQGPEHGLEIAVQAYPDVSLASRRSGFTSSWVPDLGEGAPLAIFCRGFVEQIHMDAELFLARVEALLQAAPLLRRAWLFRVGSLVTQLAASPHLERLTSLNLGGDIQVDPIEEIGDDGVEELAASSHLAGLTALGLRGNAIGDRGARALAASPHLAHLTMLDLSENDIGDAGAEALANSPYLTRLNSLVLYMTNISDVGWRALSGRFGEAVDDG